MKQYIKATPFIVAMLLIIIGSIAYSPFILFVIPVAFGLSYMRYKAKGV